MSEDVTREGTRLPVIDLDDRQVQLGRELREMRLESGTSSRQLAREAHMSQSKLLRFEQGVAVPDLDEAEALLGALSIPDDRRTSLLVDLQSTLALGRQQRELLVPTPQRHFQKEIRQLLAETNAFDEFASMTIPGLLQTAEYVRAMFSTVGLTDRAMTEAISSRIERQQILYDTSKRFMFILTEPVLRFRYVSEEALRVQMHHLLVLSSLENVSIGIVPVDRQPLAAVHGPFGIYDDRYVWVDGVINVGHYGRADIEQFRKRFVELAEAALWRDEARQFLQTRIVDPSGSAAVDVRQSLTRNG